MPHLTEASKAAVTWLIRLCRSHVITAMVSKDRRDEHVPHKGHGTAWKPSVSVSRGSIMLLIK